MTFLYAKVLISFRKLHDDGILVLFQAEAGGSGIVSRRITGQSGSDQFVMKVPNNKVWETKCII